MGNVALHFRLLLLAGANFSYSSLVCGPIIPSKALQIMEGISLLAPISFTLSSWPRSYIVNKHILKLRSNIAWNGQFIWANNYKQTFLAFISKAMKKWAEDLNHLGKQECK